MIYVIQGGEYSDIWVDGYFTNKEDAEIYCLGKPDLHIEEVPELTKPKPIKYFKHHEVVFDGTVMRKEPGNYDCYTGERKKTKPYWYNPRIFCVEVTTETREKAEKIAQDLFYKALATREGLC